MQFQHGNSKGGWPHSVTLWKHNGNHMDHLFNVLHFAEMMYVCVSYSRHNFRPCLRPLTSSSSSSSSFSYIFIFIFILLLPEWRRGEAWEPSKKGMLLLPNSTPPPLQQHKSLSSYCLALHFYSLSLHEIEQVKALPSPSRKERKRLLLLLESDICPSLNQSLAG
jgi:hypothetical protein